MRPGIEAMIAMWHELARLGYTWVWFAWMGDIPTLLVQDQYEAPPPVLGASPRMFPIQFRNYTLGVDMPVENLGFTMEVSLGKEEWASWSDDRRAASIKRHLTVGEMDRIVKLLEAKGFVNPKNVN